jgi:membrane associated rhomboid family serine protease
MAGYVVFGKAMLPLKDSISSKRWPVVTVALILANAAVFYLQLTAVAGRAEQVLVDGHSLWLRTGFEQMVWRFGLRPAELFGEAGPLPPFTPFHDVLTVLTSMFIHGGWLHISFNMLYLWIFGDNVEDAMGHARFLVFYLLAGVSAAVAQIAFDPTSIVPMVGASGAIAGVLGAYLVQYPRAKILTVIPIFIFLKFIQVPALIFLGVWFVLQVLNAQYGGGTAWYAHIGGFVFGAISVKFFVWGQGRRR